MEKREIALFSPIIVARKVTEPGDIDVSIVTWPQGLIEKTAELTGLTPEEILTEFETQIRETFGDAIRELSEHPEKDQTLIIKEGIVIDVERIKACREGARALYIIGL